MRRLILAACLISTALPAYAGGNVLLPSASSGGSNSSGSGGGVSNATLGLGGTTVSTPAPMPEMPAPPAQTSAPAQTPIPQTAAKMPTAADIITPLDPNGAKNLPAGAIPTYIIHQQDMSQALTQANAGLPYALTIALSNRSVFGAKDVQEISTKLGLSRDQIASACAMSVQGIVQTSKGSYIFDSGTSSQANIHYDGTISSYLMSARASCAVASKLPPGSGFLTEVGGRYIIPLQPIDCVSPNRQSPGLIVTYDGSGKSQCSYQ
jgi:hypothetical protein